MPYTLVAGDNFHPQEREHQYDVGIFATAAEVVAAEQAFLCKSVLEHYAPGMTAEDLFNRFSGFGEITFIFADGGDPRVDFDPWAYAKQQAKLIAAEPEGPPAD
jgi:hypothetical protein